MEVEAKEKRGSIVKNQLLEGCQITKLTWRIDNFSRLNVKKLFSEIFMVSGFKWRIFLYPKGNGVDDYLSIYLEVVDDSTAPVGWSIDADVTFNVVDQIDHKKTVDRETKGTFKQRHVSWGFATFISLHKLHDPDSSITITGSSAQDNAGLVKGHFNELISLPLNDLADPNHEGAMRESLFTLGNNLTSFSEDQIEQIKRLKDEFPRIIEDWRDSVQVLVDCQSFLSNFRKTENLLEDAVKTEEGIKATLDKLRIRTNKLEKELEAARKEAKQLAEQRREASKKTHEFYVIAEDQNGKIEDKEQEMSQARDELEDLKAEWDYIRSHFA